MGKGIQRKRRVRIPANEVSRLGCRPNGGGYTVLSNIGCKSPRMRSSLSGSVSPKSSNDVLGIGVYEDRGDSSRSGSEGSARNLL